MILPQVRARLTRWTAALSLAFNGQTLRLAAKYAMTVSVQRSCAAPGTTNNGMGLYIRLLGGLLWYACLCCPACVKVLTLLIHDPNMPCKFQRASVSLLAGVSICGRSRCACRVQLGARKPQLHTLPHLRSWWRASMPSTAQADAPATEELQLSPVPQVQYSATT